MKVFFLIAVVGLASTVTPLRAAVKTKSFDYKEGTTTLQGFYAYDDAVKGKRPGVLVIHEWWGHNQHARNQALRLAKAGYAALALDMYGKGKVTSHPKDATAFMEAVAKNPELERARFDAAVTALKAQNEVDGSKIAAIGYCFGGKVALDMARAGVDLVAVGTFHAALGAPTVPDKKGSIKTHILVQAGEADPFVPMKQVEQLRKEMADAGADLTVFTYPGVKHGFTNPEAASFKMDALAYNKAADKKSWERLVEFFARVLPAK